MSDLERNTPNLDVKKFVYDYLNTLSREELLETSDRKLAEQILNNYRIDNNVKGFGDRNLRLKIAKFKSEINEKKGLSKEKVDFFSSKIREEETDNEKSFHYDGTESITSKEQALKFFKVDTNVWKVDRWIVNSWDVTSWKSGQPEKRTNYQVKLFLKRKETPAFDFQEALSTLRKYTSPNNPTRPVNKSGLKSKPILLSIADLHTGAKTDKAKGILNTKNFSVEILVDYLDAIANKVNSLKRECVRVCILGDLVESISGMNHLDSWKGMEENHHGANAIIFTFEILRDFLKKINGLETVYFVSGNHDRMQNDKRQEAQGEACKLVSYMLSDCFDIKYHPLIYSDEFDGVYYIMTHGHTGISKQALYKIVLDYGNQDYYNVILSGHVHTRKKTQIIHTKPTQIEGVAIDSVNYRGITIAPIFPGNYYSEALGYTSSPGFSIIESNLRKDNINHYDLSL